MNLQFLTNAKGEKVSVLVSFKEWNELNQEHTELKRRLEEAQLALRYKNAFNDVKLFEEGKLNTYPIAQLFDEL